MDFSTADMCDELGEEVQVLNYGLKSYGGKVKISGKIRTVELDEDNTPLIALLKKQGDGDVAVVDVNSVYVAVVGDKLMAIALKNGWTGIVVNGYVRDVEITKNIDVGLWAMGTCPRRSDKKADGKSGGELSFDGVKFRQDDYIYADSDGVLVLDREFNL